MTGQLLSTAGRLVSADIGLQGGFAFGDGGFRARDPGFEFLHPVFHLLTLDWIQALGFGIVRRRGLVLVPVYRLCDDRRAADGFLQFLRAAFLPPAIVFVITWIDFHLSLAHFENAR